ncbi:MAG: hypothetical protein A2474_04935 [Elusimicrobia bacterium RIFOXYC2_FULL_34_12]|nr:MAG: hypothetical protein A2474_04935 [Elusimicrobia bacterium RIFOXYC2_FULL_34_12]OGS44601.1 MAG: hypothetical protein A2539_08450 [Elusimicrobia bacterium RIFOXYD2_FULL_34_15]HAM37838.1 hypothetical protein [Elusimicrobiota bacterium]
MNILLTGVSGFAGSYLAADLLESGNNVIGLDKIDDSDVIKKLLNLKKFRIIKADLSQKFNGPDNVDAIIHTAAEARPSGVPVAEYIKNNMTAVENLALYAVEAGVKKIIFFSSISVYGEIENKVVDEDTPIINPSVYGISKYIGELLLKDISDKIPSIALRLPGLLGKMAKGPWLAKVLQKVFKGEDITVYNHSEGFNNAIHLSDLAAFIQNLLKNDLKGFDVINLACSEVITVEETVKELIKNAGTSSEIKNKESENISFIISTEKAKRVYSFESSPIRSVLERFVIENKESKI